MNEKEPVKLLILEASQDRAEELIDMVRSLQPTGMLTAISGAENPVVLSTLWQAGVNSIQGYYTSRYSTI